MLLSPSMLLSLSVLSTRFLFDVAAVDDDIDDDDGGGGGGGVGGAAMMADALLNCSLSLSMNALISLRCVATKAVDSVKCCRNRFQTDICASFSLIY